MTPNNNELKSAEELSIELRDILRFYSTYPNAEARQLECLQRRIAEIQLNAYKAGMSEAAEIVIDKREQIVDTPSRLALSFTQQAILSARDRKESL